jgi:hypothetical protein
LHDAAISEPLISDSSVAGKHSVADTMAGTLQTIAIGECDLSGRSCANAAKAAWISQLLRASSTRIRPPIARAAELPNSQKALIDQCNIFAVVAAAGLEPALRFPRSRF